MPSNTYALLGVGSAYNLCAQFARWLHRLQMGAVEWGHSVEGDRSVMALGSLGGVMASSVARKAFQVRDAPFTMLVMCCDPIVCTPRAISDLQERSSTARVLRSGFMPWRFE